MSALTVAQGAVGAPTAGAAAGPGHRTRPSHGTQRQQWAHLLWSSQQWAHPPPNKT